MFGPMFGSAALSLLGGVSRRVSRGRGAFGGGGGVRRRRRKARLTPGDITELTQIKMILGKSAAAAALPYYMGRGRG